MSGIHCLRTASVFSLFSPWQLCRMTSTFCIVLIISSSRLRHIIYLTYLDGIFQTPCEMKSHLPPIHTQTDVWTASLPVDINLTKPGNATWEQTQSLLCLQARICHYHSWQLTLYSHKDPPGSSLHAIFTILTRLSVPWLKGELFSRTGKRLFTHYISMLWLHLPTVIIINFSVPHYQAWFKYGEGGHSPPLPSVVNFCYCIYSTMTSN